MTEPTPNPLVSVVIPVHDGERYLAECLSSVQSQSYRPIETIVVDDGSSDSSVEIASQAPGVRLIRQANRDVSAARNAGVRAAGGVFIAFLDYDDLWLPEKIEKQVAWFGLHPQDELVFTDIVKFDDAGHVRHARDRHRWARRLSGPRAFPSLARKNPVLPSAVLVRRESLIRAGLFNEAFRTCGDYEMWLRMAGLGMRFGYLPLPLTRYRVHAGNTGRRIEVMHEDRLRAVRVAFADSRIPPRLRRFERLALASAHLEGAHSFFGAGRPDLFLEQVRTAVRLWPWSLDWKTIRRCPRAFLSVHPKPPLTRP